MRFADLDCVTVDASGTLVVLDDPVSRLRHGLLEHGIERAPAEIEAAFRAEIAYYRGRAVEGRDAESVALIRRECCGVFIAELGLGLDPDAFLPDFIASYRFRIEEGAAETLRSLQARGLRIAVVSNWDCSLGETLEGLGLSQLVDIAVASALVGSVKPDPEIFRYALAKLSAEPSRSLHVGDEESDRLGALAAGMHFAPAPLATAFEGWT
ncbi:MAG: HAD-IA family hydrolase [Gaiellaceae bacterium]|jgi:HAD superfamily hydrolase (TIGR01509 family)